MKFWWVNQNQTYRQEFHGGYIWSPKRKADGGRNPFYDSMREVSPGDIVFSFCDTFIRALGIAVSYCFESPKPAEFGTAGPNWNQVGWRVQVEWKPLIHQVRPKDHIDLIRPHLPEKYAPLRSTGDGNQGIYLTDLPAMLANVVGDLIGPEFHARIADSGDSHSLTDIDSKSAPLLDEWEQYLQHGIEANDRLAPTTKEALVQARIGQGLFKKRVGQIEHCCRITKVDNPTHLIASHCKPWRDSGDEERLDGENGLLLTPSIDHLFDRGFISFEDNGDLLVSPVAHHNSLKRMGIAVDQSVNVGGFSSGQRNYLDYHRESVFLKRPKKI